MNVTRHCNAGGCLDVVGFFMAFLTMSVGLTALEELQMPPFPPSLIIRCCEKEIYGIKVRKIYSSETYDGPNNY